MNLNITRRQFLQYCAASAAALGLSQTDLLKLEKALATPQQGTGSPTPSVIYMSGQNCSGCQTSLLNRVVDCGGSGYYDADMINAVYYNAVPTVPQGTPSDPAGIYLNVVNDVADLLVGDAVRALVPPLGGLRALNWADDLGGVAALLPNPNPFPGGFITLEWLTTVNAGAGDINVTHLKSIVNGDTGGFVLLLDGSIPGDTNGSTTPGGPIWSERYALAFDNEDENGAPAISWIPTGDSVTIADCLRWMCNSGNCLAVVCVGTCSSFGGVPAARGKKTGAKGFYGIDSGTPGIPNPTNSWLYYNQTLTYGKDANRYLWTIPPVINCPGCPPHPDWVIAPVAYFLIHGALPAASAFDSKRRLLLTYPAVPFCQNCPNSPTQNLAPEPGNPNTRAYSLGDSGCLGVDKGCKGSNVFGDCWSRQKNVFDDGTVNNWCVGSDLGPNIGRARHPCQGCIEPTFPDGMSRVSFYESVF